MHRSPPASAPGRAHTLRASARGSWSTASRRRTNGRSRTSQRGGPRREAPRRASRDRRPPTPRRAPARPAAAAPRRARQAPSPAAAASDGRQAGRRAAAARDRGGCGASAAAVASASASASASTLAVEARAPASAARARSHRRGGRRAPAVPHAAIEHRAPEATRARADEARLVLPAERGLVVHVDALRPRRDRGRPRARARARLRHGAHLRAAVGLRLPGALCGHAGAPARGRRRRGGGRPARRACAVRPVRGLRRRARQRDLAARRAAPLRERSGDRVRRGAQRDRSLERTRTRMVRRHAAGRALGRPEDPHRRERAGTGRGGRPARAGAGARAGPAGRLQPALLRRSRLPGADPAARRAGRGAGAADPRRGRVLDRRERSRDAGPAGHSVGAGGAAVGGAARRVRGDPPARAARARDLDALRRRPRRGARRASPRLPAASSSRSGCSRPTARRSPRSTPPGPT